MAFLVGSVYIEQSPRADFCVSLLHIPLPLHSLDFEDTELIAM